MVKKGHKRKNWTERWFELHLTYISYYVNEDRVEQKGCISLDRNCCVEVQSLAIVLNSHFICVAHFTITYLKLLYRKCMFLYYKNKIVLIYY